jgi:hypothetical protein
MVTESHENGRTASSGLVKVRFPLDESDVSMGVVAETLWALPLGQQGFQIDNIPFYIYGISNRDVVSAVPISEIFEFQQVLRRGAFDVQGLGI